MVSVTCIKAQSHDENMFAFPQRVQSRSRKGYADGEFGAAQSQRNPHIAWMMGVIIAAIVDFQIGYLFCATKCEAPVLARVMVPVVSPGMYLVLMYLTLKRQP